MMDLDELRVRLHEYIEIRDVVDSNDVLALLDRIEAAERTVRNQRRELRRLNRQVEQMPRADDGVRSVDELRAEVAEMADEILGMRGCYVGAEEGLYEEFTGHAGTIAQVEAPDEVAALRMLRGALLARLGR